MTRKRTKRITGARDLTVDDYRDMLVNDKRSKEDLEQQKIKRREERERKNEREKKKEEVAKKKDNVRRGKNRKGGGKDKLQQQPVGRSQMLHSSSDSDSDTGVVTAPRISVPAILASLVQVLVALVVKLNCHLVSGLTVIVTTMMVQSAQYVDVTNLKD